MPETDNVGTAAVGDPAPPPPPPPPSPWNPHHGSDGNTNPSFPLIHFTTHIVTTYLAANQMPSSEIPEFITVVHQAVADAHASTPPHPSEAIQTADKRAPASDIPADKGGKRIKSGRKDSR